jgi:hypothetical protein
MSKYKNCKKILRQSCKVVFLSIFSMILLFSTNNFVVGIDGDSLSDATSVPNLAGSSLESSKEISNGVWEEVNPGIGNEEVPFFSVSVGKSKKKKGKGSQVWAIGGVKDSQTNEHKKKVFRLTNKKGWIPEIDGELVSASSDGTVVAVDDNKYLFKRTGKKRWEKIPDLSLSHISVANKNTMWGVLQDEDSHKAFKFIDGSWSPVMDYMGDHAEGFTKFTVNLLGTVWAINEDGKLFAQNSQRLQDLKEIQEKKDLGKELSKKRKSKIKRLKKRIKKLERKKNKSKKEKRRLKRFKKRVKKLQRKGRKRAKKKKGKKKGKKKKKKRGKKAKKKKKDRKKTK